MSRSHPDQNDKDAVIERQKKEIAELQMRVLQLEFKLLISELERTQRVSPRDPDNKPVAPNPPETLVHGKIEVVDGDLVLVTLGTDHGLNADNTLEAYRLKPAPKYLGMIRIVHAYERKSLGRFMKTGDAPAPKLEAGDLVASKLTPKQEQKKKE
jgi:hypothetical protein